MNFLFAHGAPRMVAALFCVSLMLGSGAALVADELSDYTQDFALCADSNAPDCARLPLGDAFHSTTNAKRGFLYSCDSKNPNAPGSSPQKTTWIDFTKSTWNLLQKPWLPAGDFNPQNGTYSEQITDATRTITVNNLPKDSNIGDWPMTDYALLTAIDRNPGIPSAQEIRITAPRYPQQAESPSCAALGVIGVTFNGVVLFNAADGRGNDALAHEIVDEFGGHPAREEYHYHSVPPRLDARPLPSGHSPMIGYIKDGFPIYGYRGNNGKQMTNDDLDICHGHAHDTLDTLDTLDALDYHYHATLEYPYTIGCYRGTPLPTTERRNRAPNQ